MPDENNNIEAKPTEEPKPIEEQAPPDVRTFRIRVRGTAPLIMHRWTCERTSNEVFYG